MGFAVIPIIFTVAEDSLSSVPAGLAAGSLALGATRWQTAIRIVLPTASPGIFSAVMIGFGRAVGETMIVLMATGNTAVMNMSMFNGFRALSANIAVELPEAPVDGTLYRVLFLAALLLFVHDVPREHRGRARAAPAAEEVPDVRMSSVPVFATRPAGLFRSGEPWIWVTGAALGAALVMVAGLLGLDPLERPRLLLAGGPGRLHPEGRVGRRRPARGCARRFPSPGRPPGRRGASGSSSSRRTATSSETTSSGWTRTRSSKREVPPDLVVLERREWGDFFGRVKEVRDGEKVLATGTEASWRKLEELLPKALEVRRAGARPREGPDRRR